MGQLIGYDFVLRIIEFVTPAGGVTEVGNNNPSILDKGGIE